MGVPFQVSIYIQRNKPISQSKGASKGLRGRIKLLRIKSIGRITLKDPKRGRLRGISPWHRVNAAFRDLKEVE
jgi:hypothetical protein